MLSNPGKVRKKHAQLVANASQLASGKIGKSETKSKTKSKKLVEKITHYSETWVGCKHNVKRHTKLECHYNAEANQWDRVTIDGHDVHADSTEFHLPDCKDHLSGFEILLD